MQRTLGPDQDATGLSFGQRSAAAQQPHAVPERAPLARQRRGLLSQRLPGTLRQPERSQGSGLGTTPAHQRLTRSPSARQAPCRVLCSHGSRHRSARQHRGLLGQSLPGTLQLAD